MNPKKGFIDVDALSSRTWGCKIWLQLFEGTVTVSWTFYTEMIKIANLDREIKMAQVTYESCICDGNESNIQELSQKKDTPLVSLAF